MDGSLLNFAVFRDTRMKGVSLRRAIYSKANLFSLPLGAADCSIWIEGADFSAARFSERTKGTLFGSKDTIVDHHYEQQKAAGLKLTEKLFLEDFESGHTAEERSEMIAKAPEGALLFLDWNPFTMEDFAAGEFRKGFIERHNLKGWPFED